VFVFGVWLVVTTKYSTLFLSQRYAATAAIQGKTTVASAESEASASSSYQQPGADEVTGVEFVMDSNGWFRARVGQESWVFWSQVDRSHQDLEDEEALEMVAGTPRHMRRRVLPGSRLVHSHCTLAFAADHMTASFHKSAIAALDVVIPRLDVVALLFDGHRFFDVPVTND
jgi:hypothetical protein